MPPPNDYFNLEIINQGQRIKPEELKIENQTLNGSLIKIITTQHPREYYLDKKITLKGKLISSLIAEKMPAPYMSVFFYEQEVGFLDLHSQDADFLKIGECVTYSDGNFELKNITATDGPGQLTRDILTAIELSSNYAVMYNSLLGTKTIYKFKLNIRENIWPYEDVYNLGDIDIAVLTNEPAVKIFSFIQNQLIFFRNQNPAYNRPAFIVYPATKIYMDIKDDIRFLYSDNILKITKKGGDYILKYGFSADNISDLLKEAASGK